MYHGDVSRTHSGRDLGGIAGANGSFIPVRNYIRRRRGIRRKEQSGDKDQYICNGTHWFLLPTKKRITLQQNLSRGKTCDLQQSNRDASSEVYVDLM
jgi:hypothetical protein